MDPKSLVGRTVADRYRLESFIGGGSFGAVYRGVDTRFGDDLASAGVAVKLSMGEISENAFRREARLLRQVNHPNVVRVQDFGKDLTIPAHYIVMELLEGTPFEKLVANGPLPTEQVAALGLQIGKALSAVHQLNMAHRDLSANNILLVSRDTEEARFVLIDFGISAKFDAQKSLGAGTVKGFGTPEYMPPEMFSVTSEDEDVDFETAQRVDVYAFGVILYRALSGQKPFALKSSSPEGFAQLVYEVKNTPAQAPSQVCNDRRLTPPVDNLILSCLAKNPSDRPQTTVEVGRKLTPLLGMTAPSSGTIDVIPYSPKPPSSGRGIQVFLVFCMLAFMGFLLSPPGWAYVREFLAQVLPEAPPPTLSPELKAYPNPLDLVAGQSKELSVVLDASDLSEFELIHQLQEDSGIDITELEPTAADTRKFMVSANLNAESQQVSLDFLVDIDNRNQVTTSVPVNIQAAKFWPTDNPNLRLPSGGVWSKQGELFRLRGTIFSEKISLQVPEYKEPIDFQLIYDEKSSESPFFMMVNKVPRDLYAVYAESQGDMIPEAWGNETQLPADSLSINEAEAFAQWLVGFSGTIPTFEEWERAAAGGPYAPALATEPITPGLRPVGLFPDESGKFKIREMMVNGVEMLRSISDGSKVPLAFPIEDSDIGFFTVGTHATSNKRAVFSPLSPWNYRAVWPGAPEANTTFRVVLLPGSIRPPAEPP